MERRDGGLSFAQRRLWIVEQMAGQGWSLHARLLRLWGGLDVASLQGALQDVVARHDALRMTLPVVDGAPAVRLVDTIEPRVRLVDLRAQADPDLAAWRHEVARCRERVPIAEAPPWWVEVLRLRDDEHAVMVIAHPLVADARSVELLVGELAEAYTARARGEPAPFAAPPLPYSAYARAQAERMQGDELERRLGYWRRQLAGAPPGLAFARDGRRGERPAPLGASELLACALPFACVRAAADLAARSGATLHAVLLASLVVLLHRYTGATDLVVGAPHDGRTEPGHEGVLGPLADLLPLRVQVDPAERFDGVVARVHRLAAEARAHALPLARLIEELRPGAFAQEGAVRVAFALGHDDGRALGRIAGLTADPQPIARGTMELDLDVSLLAAGGALVVGVEYRTARHERPFVVQLVRSWLAMLEALGSGGGEVGGELAAIPILAPRDRAWIEAWNDTARDLGSDTVVQMIDAAARRDPDHLALLGAEGSLTYGALVERAERWARRLAAEGVGPETIVAVVLERSFELVVALLAVLRAGGAYLPIDPACPGERRAFMLEDAGASLVICRAPLAVALPARVLAVGELDAAGARALPGGAALPAPRPDQLAYVIYTSGSTGQPKGVAIEHGALANQLQWLRSAFPLSPADRVACKYGLAFDASLWELLGTLVCGAQLVLAAAGRERELDHLIELCARHEVTVLDVVPSTLEALLRHPQLPRLARLRRVTCGGEALSAATARLAAARVAAELHNLYGPTEATITASSYRVGEALDGDTVPIGRPAANTTLHVLDDALRPVPPGVVGEIYIGGAQVARGYVRRPELTRACFVDDPSLPRGAGRLFRTGDLGRLRGDGELEFVGRRDLQVKVRGHRIELEEVEAAIASHPAVRECAVVLEAGHGPAASLSAYLVAEAGCAPSTHELRGTLRERLPSYMVPARFFRVPSLPATPEGKLDRAAVARLTGERLAEQADAPPRSHTERRLAALWRELLGCDQPGVRTDFFDAGGDSLLAVTLVRRISEELGSTAEVRDVFEAPTIELLAGRLEESVAVRRAAALPPIAAAPSPAQVAALSPLQERRLRGAPLASSEPRDHLHLAVWLDGLLDEEAMRWALRQVAARHAMLRTRFADDGGRRVQIVEPDATAPLACARLEAADPAARERALRELVAAQAEPGFDLRRAPIVRAVLARAGDEAHALVIASHRAVMDGPSLDLLLRDLSRFYFHRVDGCELPRPIAFAYADFVGWQRELRAGPALAPQAAYWRGALAGAPPTPLPRHAAGRRPASPGGRAAVAIPDAAAAAVLGLARRNGVGPFVLLLAAFQALLGRLGGLDDLVVGTPITGRRGLPEIEPLVGVFDGLLPLRADLSGELSFEALIHRVRDVAYGARVHQEILLVEPSIGERVALGSAVFAYEVQQPRRVGTVALRPITIDVGEAPHDLELRVIERAGSLAGSLRYRAAILETAEAEHLARAYARLLAAAAADPTRRMSALWSAIEAEDRGLALP